MCIYVCIRTSYREEIHRKSRLSIWPIDKALAMMVDMKISVWPRVSRRPMRKGFVPCSVFSMWNNASHSRKHSLNTNNEWLFNQLKKSYLNQGALTIEICKVERWRRKGLWGNIELFSLNKNMIIRAKGRNALVPFCRRSCGASPGFSPSG